MRNAFAQELLTVACEDQRVVLLSGDIGNRLFDKYKAACPNRFFNCGVAEANMMGAAAGLALSGMRPVVYTIAPFLTTRCYEQIRVDVCCQKAPVIIAAVGAGLSYASLGPTHCLAEDVAILRALPNMKVVCPGDPHEVRAALRAALREAGPVYLRLGKKGESPVHPAVPPGFEIGRLSILKPGADVCLLAAGTILVNALAAAELLAGQGISAAVASFHTVKPLDTAFLAEAFGRFKLVATIEEHGLNGGAGSAVAEWLADCRPRPPGLLVRIGMHDEFFHAAGGQAFARRHFGLMPDQIADRIMKEWKNAI